jgi:hypothetical protein
VANLAKERGCQSILNNKIMVSEIKTIFKEKKVSKELTNSFLQKRRKEAFSWSFLDSDMVRFSSPACEIDMFRLSDSLLALPAAMLSLNVWLSRKN